MTWQSDTCNIYRALKELADKKEPFTTSSLREKLGYGESAPEARRLHALIQKLKRDGVIDVVSQGRRRHQHLQVIPKKNENLQQLMDKALRKKDRNGADVADTSNRMSPSITLLPKRVLYLEHRVEQVETGLDRIANLEQKVAELKEKVHKLMELWS